MHCARRTLEKFNYKFDIALLDFYLFRLLLYLLRGKKFQNLDNVQIAISRYFVQKLIDTHNHTHTHTHTHKIIYIHKVFYIKIKNYYT